MATYIIIGIALFLFLVAIIFSATAYQRYLKIYNKYIHHYTNCKLTGLQLAQYMVLKLKLKTKIATSEQKFCDSFLTSKNQILLSNEVANSNSIASLAITAHEMAHAQQKNKKQFLFMFSMVLAHINFIGKFVILPFIVAGLVLLFFPQYMFVGEILLLIVAIIFISAYLLKLVNIPVEFGASKIAYEFLEKNYVLNAAELKCAKKILRVAGQTYIASLFMGFVKIFKSFGRLFRS